MASVTYGKSIMSSVIMAKILWQMKLSLNLLFKKNSFSIPRWYMFMELSGVKPVYSNIVCYVLPFMFLMSAPALVKLQ